MTRYIPMDKNHFNLFDDKLFKSFARSKEARPIISEFLSCVTGIPVSDLLNADYVGGEHTKTNVKEKNKESDIIVKIDDKRTIILEMNQQYALNLFEKNTSYAFTLANINTKVSDKEYPAIILVNIDNFNYYKTRKPILHFQLKDQEGHIENTMYNSYHIIVENCLRKRYNKEEIKKFMLFLSQTNMNSMKDNFEGDNDYMAGYVKIEDMLRDVDKEGLLYEVDEEEPKEIVYLESQVKERERRTAENVAYELTKKTVIGLKKNGASDKMIMDSLQITKEELEEYLKDIK